jgi:hypothetical protein
MYTYVNTDVEHLEKYGYFVLPTETFSNPMFKRDLLEEAGHFPEFQQKTKKFVMGGFAALGNPSSFHNTTVRKYRQWAMGIVVTRLLKPLVKQTGVAYNIEQFMERMSIRVPGETPSAESWHRDESTVSSGNDKTFGGWVNLDDKPQHFSCVPGSHYKNTTSHRGFAKIPKSDAAECKSRSIKVVIPPGHILVFYENIIHEVLTKKSATTMVRVYLGWRLTTSFDMREEMVDVLAFQGVPLLKSGQVPPMYSKCHWVNWIDNLQTWSLGNMHEKCLVDVQYQAGKRAGEKFVIVDRFLKSLCEYGFPMYPGYSIDEMKAYKPSNSWKLLAPGSDCDYVEFKL